MHSLAFLFILDKSCLFVIFLKDSLKTTKTEQNKKTRTTKNVPVWCKMRKRPKFT